MIHVETAALREIRLRLVEPFQTSVGRTEEKRIILLELTSSDGVTAWSECVAESLPTYSPDTVDTCWLALAEWIMPAILGREIASPSNAHAILERKVCGHRMARAAVEMGIWTLAAASEEIPLAEMLVRESEYSRAESASPRPSVATGIAIGMQDTPAALADRVAASVREGYRRIRMKIAPGGDIEFARAARDAAGKDVLLAVDGNGSYSLDSPDHVRALEELDDLGLAMIEQPLARDDLVEHAELQRTMRTPICLDESVTGDSSAAAMLALGSGRVINLKAGRVGGFREAIAIHDRCARAGIPVWCGGMLESGIGRAYNVALASLPNFTLPGDLSPSSRYWERDVVTSPWTMDSSGMVQVPLSRPGIGVEVDLGFVDELTVRREKFRGR